MANDFNLDQFPLPKDWIRQELIDCTEDRNISYGIVQPGKHLDEGIPVLRVNNIGNNSLDLDAVMKVDPKIEEKYLRTRLLGGEVLLTLVGSTGQSIIAPEYMKGWNVARAIAVIRADENIGADWINICLQSRETHHYLNSRANTTVQKTLNLKDVRSIPIPIPPLKTKLFIENIATSLSKKIELNRQMNETLEAMAQALFKSWFVDFDPVIDNALAAGNTIPDEFIERAEQRKAIEKKDHSDNQSLFPNEFEFTEEMGWIPKGWEVENLDKKIDVLNGFAFKSKDYVEKGLFVLRTKNFTSEGSVEILGDDVYLPNEFENTFSKYLSEPFDYHLVMVGASVGNRGLIEPHQLPALRNQNMWCFRPKPNSQISRSYVKYMLDFVTPQKLGLASGSAREFFRKGDFQKHQLCLPSNATLNKFDQIAFSYLKKKAQNNSENVSLSKLRDTLLPKLMSGELSIPDDVF